MFCFDCCQWWLSAGSLPRYHQNKGIKYDNVSWVAKKKWPNHSFLAYQRSLLNHIGWFGSSVLIVLIVSAMWSVEVLAIVCFGCSAVIVSIGWVCFGIMMSGSYHALEHTSGPLAGTSRNPGVWIGQCQTWLEGQSLVSRSWWKLTIIYALLHSSLAAVFDLCLIWSNCFVHFIGCRIHHLRWSGLSKSYVVTFVIRWRRCGSTGFRWSFHASAFDALITITITMFECIDDDIIIVVRGWMLRSFEEHDKTKQKMSGLHTEVQEEVAWHQNGKQVVNWVNWVKLSSGSGVWIKYCQLNQLLSNGMRCQLSQLLWINCSMGLCP